MMLLLLACAPGGDDSAPEDTDVDCSAYTGLATTAELAVSPRLERDPEDLALCLDGGLVATEATYTRVVADLPVAQALVAGSDAGSYGDASLHAVRACTDDAATWAAVEDGSYTGWTCANRLYQGGLTDKDATNQCARIDFVPRLDARALLDVYTSHPGFVAADIPTPDGDGPTWRGAWDGSTAHYVYDARAGDCPSGCTEGVAYHFVSTAAGEVTLVERWTWTDDGAPAPDWYTTWNVCGTP